MKTQNLVDVKHLCREVLALAEQQETRHYDRESLKVGTKKSAELRRRSMDLSNALAKLRQER